MHTNLLQQGGLPKGAAESPGRIARRRPLAVERSDALTPLPRRGAEAAMFRLRSVSAVSVASLLAGARAKRARRAGRVVALALRAACAFVRSRLEQAGHRRVAAATARALRGLDHRTLHDLGFRRSELHSVALEISGGKDASRVRAILSRT